MATVPIYPALFDIDYGASQHLTTELEAPWTNAASFMQVIEDIRSDVAIDAEVLTPLLILLQSWHTMWVGPPGTGKTLLAERLAQVWNVELVRVTPSMDWTAFHAIGGLGPGRGRLEPYDGVVTRAALDCCKTAARYAATGAGPQGVWLLVDEINRCEADRVFSPLLTTLGSRTEPQVLDLPYHDELPKRRLYLPPMFRILATANLSDAQFVEQFSQAFLRRFQRVDLRPPEHPPLGTAITTFPPSANPQAIANGFLQEMAVVANAAAALRPGASQPDLEAAGQLLAQLALLCRYCIRWPGSPAAPERLADPYDTLALGTAQILDALLLSLDLVDAPAGLNAESSADVAAARTIVPQLARVGPQSLHRIRDELSDLGILSRVCEELDRLIERFETGSFT